MGVVVEVRFGSLVGLVGWWGGWFGGWQLVDWFIQYAR